MVERGSIRYITLLDSLHYAKSSLTCVLSEAFLILYTPFSDLGPPSIEKVHMAPKKLQLKTEVSDDFA